MKNMKTKIIKAIVIVAILVGSVVVANVLIKTKPITKIRKAEELVINVKQYEVENKDYDVIVDYPARVAAKYVVKLGVQVSGRILPSDVPLKVGQHFKKGDLLVNIYDEDIRASLISQKSQFLNTLAKSLPDIKIDFSSEYAKWSSFFENIILDEPLPKLPATNSLKEKVYLSAKGIISNYYTIQQSQIILDKYELYAPFDGVFRDVNKEVGSMSSAGSDIGTITSTGTLELVVGVSAVESKLIGVGNTVKVTASEGNEYKGTVVRISPIVDQRTQRVMVYVSLKELSRDIIEGQMVNVEINLNNLKNVVRVPREIITNDEQVYEIVNSKLSPIDVNVLMNVGAYTYIRGLENGKKIVFESLVKPKNGTAINVIENVENN